MLRMSGLLVPPVWLRAANRAQHQLGHGLRAGNLPCHRGCEDGRRGTPHGDSGVNAGATCKHTVDVMLLHKSLRAETTPAVGAAQQRGSLPVRSHRGVEGCHIRRVHRQFCLTCEDQPHLWRWRWKEAAHTIWEHFLRLNPGALAFHAVGFQHRSWELLLTEVAAIVAEPTHPQDGLSLLQPGIFRRSPTLGLGGCLVLWHCMGSWLCLWLSCCGSL